ncbi:MAG: hypothetical protein GF331_26735, partial [Chitinivibrionales bacterium]|nr:hypothetical protein [Chitinivibrionales bacterium]
MTAITQSEESATFSQAQSSHRTSAQTGARTLTGKQFVTRFLTTETVGFAFGVPVAAAYALILAPVQGHIDSIITWMIGTTVAIVLFVALPTNLRLLHGVPALVDALGEGRLGRADAEHLLRRLVRLPLKHGLCMFGRIFAGCVIVASRMILLGVTPLQTWISAALAVYGAYVASIAAYVLATMAQRAIMLELIARDLIDRETVTRQRIYGMSNTWRILLFVAVPVAYTSLSSVAAYICATHLQMGHADVLMRLSFVCAVNLLTLFTGITLVLVTTSRPLHTLEQSLQTHALQTGDLRFQIPVDLADEHSFIGFLINQSNHNMIELVSHLKRSVETLAAASEQLLAVAATLTDRTRAMSRTASDAASSTEHLTERMSAISSLTTDFHTAITAITGAVSDFRGTVNHIAETSERSRRETEQTVEAMHEAAGQVSVLGGRVHEVEKVAQVVDHIADRVKLLALNASIEAATAGEHGRGFAVVAGEVKELARQTTEETHKIRVIVDAARAVAQHSVDSIGDNDTRVKSINDRMVAISADIDKQSQAIDSIASRLSQTLHGINKLSESAAAMVPVTRGISKGAAENKSMGEAIREQAEALTANAQQLAQLSRSMRDIA